MTTSVLVFTAALLLGACSSSENKENDGHSDSTATETTEAPPVEKDTLEVSGHIEFPSKDGLTITADSYESLPGKDFILLCHQADCSRGEYIETAKKLNGLGYNCLAIDQRSGKTCNNVENLTAKRAIEQGLKTGFMDAEQDILAAIEYIHQKTGNKVIVVGSSYSASLILKLAKKMDMISAIAVFSPSECLDGVKLQKEIAGLEIPVFATSSKKEAKAVNELLSGVKNKSCFVPTAEGDHGSKVLWNTSQNKDEYWQAFEKFLKEVTAPVI